MTAVCAVDRSECRGGEEMMDMEDRKKWNVMDERRRRRGRGWRGGGVGGTLRLTPSLMMEEGQSRSTVERIKWCKLGPILNHTPTTEAEESWWCSRTQQPENLLFQTSSVYNKRRQICKMASVAVFAEWKGHLCPQGKWENLCEWVSDWYVVLIYDECEK